MRIYCRIYIILLDAFRQKKTKFYEKSFFFQKLPIIVKNIIFCQHILVNNRNFVKNRSFRQKIVKKKMKFWSNIEILLENRHFSQESIPDKNRYF